MNLKPYKKLTLKEAQQALEDFRKKYPQIIDLFEREFKKTKTEKKDKPCMPDAGHLRFYVECSRLDTYTVIGADNQHHASNKATKLFGPHWTCVTTRMAMNGTQYVTPIQFKELLSTL